eukprot:11158618-Lingulodinium_polyedra.AAC.1
MASFSLLCQRRPLRPEAPANVEAAVGFHQAGTQASSAVLHLARVPLAAYGSSFGAFDAPASVLAAFAADAEDALF